METISAHRVLAELKTIEDRIENATKAEFVSLYVGDDGVPSGYKTVKDFEDRAKGNWDSVTDLIKRRNALKAALVASNAITEVMVAGKKMTVAEAIDRKTSINYEKLLLAKLRTQHSMMTKRVDAEKLHLDQIIQKRMEDAVGGKDKKFTLTESDAKEIENIAKKRYAPHVVDPIHIFDKIVYLQEQISSFELDVDVALSESNARTMIDIVI